MIRQLGFLITDSVVLFDWIDGDKPFGMGWVMDSFSPDGYEVVFVRGVGLFEVWFDFDKFRWCGRRFLRSYEKSN